MNKYAVNHTPHDTTRFYVSKDATKARKFLETVCLWGNFDHEINGYIEFEVKKSILASVANIMDNALDMVYTPEILH